jgi:DNA-binding NarL/FixJ family response regulator
MSPIQVALVEDHTLTRVGMRTALEQTNKFKVVGDAANGHDGLRLLQTTKPDIAIVDVGLPDMNGIELTRKFREFQAETSDRKTKVLILTLNDSEDTVLAAFTAGADSYCMKDTNLDRLVEAIEATYAGENWIDSSIARIVLKEVRPVGAKPTVAIDAIEPEYTQMLAATPLTDRELDVLALIVAGHSNYDIADKLYITVGTVKTHVRNILNKLCVNDRTQAAVRALRAGLVA